VAVNEHEDEIKETTGNKHKKHKEEINTKFRDHAKEVMD
jgi:hypothetical protein